LPQRKNLFYGQERLKRGLTGQYVADASAGGEVVRAFVPHPLPPRPPLTPDTLYVNLFLKQGGRDLPGGGDRDRLAGEWARCICRARGRRDSSHRANEGDARHGPGLAASVRVNTPDARLTVDHVVTDRLQEMVDANFKFYKRVTDDREFARFMDATQPSVSDGRCWRSSGR
jgi:hypothetical protein